MNQIFSRFIEIWKPDFLSKMLKEESSRLTWIFWFMANTLVSVVLAFFVAGALMGAIQEGSDYLQQNYPDAAVEIKEGILTVTGIEEPIFKEDKENNSVFILDTQETTYNKESLDNYRSGVIISSTGVYFKDGAERKEFLFKDLTKEEGLADGISFSQLGLQKWLADHWMQVKIVLGIVLFMGVWIWANLLRLVSAFWWALVGWIVAKIMQVEVAYQKIYFAVLNFYLIPLVLTSLLSMTGFRLPFATTLVFVILFVINFQKLKQLGLQPPLESTNPSPAGPSEPTH